MIYYFVAAKRKIRSKQQYYELFLVMFALSVNFFGLFNLLCLDIKYNIKNPHIEYNIKEPHTKGLKC